jgi:hypothetical protein
MRNAAALAVKKERCSRLEVELEAKQRALPDNRHGVIYADPLCQRLLFPRIQTAIAFLCRSQCRAADRTRRKRRRDER